MNLEGWQEVLFVQRFVREQMKYSFDYATKRPIKAFEYGKGDCWQQAWCVMYILRRLGYRCYIVYSFKNKKLDIIEENKIPLTCHAWCKVKYNHETKSVCTCNINNYPGKVHFETIGKIYRYNILAILLWHIKVMLYCRKLKK